MGHCVSKDVRMNKNHQKQKMFKCGLSMGRNDLTLEGHVQIGYTSKTVKNYTTVQDINEPISESPITPS